MPSKYICPYNAEELYKLYITENRTILEMCEICGCKSDITMSKVLKANGISTDKNQMRVKKTMQNMNDIDFRNWLYQKYEVEKLSMIKLSKEMGVSHTIARRYLIKYGFSIRTRSEQQTGVLSQTWKGGRRVKQNGYIEIYNPTHPRANKRGAVYEHVLVAEKTIGRYLKDDEVVHHINRIRGDNRPENLMVLTKSEHTKLHNADKSFGHYKKGVVIS